MEGRKLSHGWGKLMVSGAWYLHIDPQRGADLMRQADRNRYFILIMQACEHNKVKPGDLFLCGSLNEAMALLAERPANELDRVIFYGQYWFLTGDEHIYHNPDIHNPDSAVVQLFNTLAPALTDDILYSLDQIKEMEEGDHIIHFPHRDN